MTVSNAITRVMSDIDGVTVEVMSTVVSRLYDTDDPNDIQRILRRLANMTGSLVTLSMIEEGTEGSDLGRGIATELEAFFSEISRECLRRAGSPGCGTTTLRDRDPLGAGPGGEQFAGGAGTGT